jgi:hypothetical protein
MSLKQNNSVQDYIDNFMSLVNQIGKHELTKKEALNYFVEGLQNDAKFQIHSRKLEELDDAILIASE